MAYTPGTFTATALQKARAKASELWASDAWNKQWKRPTGVFNFITNRQGLRVQGTRLQTLSDGRHCNIHQVYFLQDVNDTTSNTYNGDNTDCVITGAQLGSDVAEYSTSDLAIFSRLVKSVKCKNDIEFNELTGQALINIENDIALDLEKDAISFVVANKKGTLTGFSPTTGTWDETNDKWVVTSAQANAEFLAEVKMRAEIFRMKDPVLLSGTHYYLDKIKAAAEPNAGYQNFNTLLSDQNMPIVHNIVDFDTLSGGTKMYLVDASTIGFVPASTYMNTAPASNTADLYYWGGISRSLTYRDGNEIKPVPIDWRMQRACTGANALDFSDGYEGKVEGVFMESPQPEQTIYPNIVEISVEG